MTLKKLFAYITVLGLCAAASAVRASDIPLTVALTVKISAQNSSTDNGTTTTTLPPVVKARATVDILKKLAVDEFSVANWPSNSFPSTAKLAAAGNGFAVVNGTNILVDVSDIITFDTGTNEITSGVQNDLTGLASPKTTKLHTARISFDDTAFLDPDGGLVFYMQGIMTETKTDTAPVNGIYTETRLAKMINATGEGTSNIGSGTEHPFVITGTVIAAGKASLSL